MLTPSLYFWQVWLKQKKEIEEYGLGLCCDLTFESFAAGGEK